MNNTVLYIIFMAGSSLLIGSISAAAFYYFEPSRVIRRLEKREAQKSRLKAMKAFNELKQYDDK